MTPSWIKHQDGKSFTAQQWFERMNAADVSEAERVAFLEWLATDAAHEAEYARLEQVCALTADLSNDEEVRAYLRSERWLRASRRRRFRSLVAVAAAAVILAAAVVGFFAFDDDRYHTDIGERRVVTLADNSVMHLNTDSVVEVDYTDKARHVLLLRGEVFFDVRRDQQGRPFVVEADNREVRVLGTRFNVRHFNRETVVEVLEGQVEVLEQRDGQASVISTLGVGQKLALDALGIVAQSDNADPARIAAWQAGRLEFTAVELSEVIKEFNRYSRTKIVLGQASLTSYKVSGSFEAGQSLAFVRALEKTFPIKAVTKPGEVVLLPAEGTSSINRQSSGRL